jgi:transcriptional regulator with XRE-family HTH domain
MWHVWVKAFRDRNDLTQDQAADMLGVDARTIRRWEAGTAEPTLATRTRLAHHIVPSPAHQLGEQLKSLLDLTSDFIMLFDQDLTVVAQSKSHQAHMALQYGHGDMVGKDWRRYMPATFDKFLADLGGPRGMVTNGFVSIRSGFLRQAGEKGGAIASAGLSDHTLLRLPEGIAHISVTRIMRPEGFTVDPPLLTFLDT